jgi:hypothetical protein
MCDIDGCISGSPEQFNTILSALKAAGHHVNIVSGDNPKSPSGPTFASKVAYLQSVGVTDCWDQLVVVTGDIPAAKAKWCKENNVQIAFDNSIPNAKAMIGVGVPLVVVPWATREKT